MLRTRKFVAADVTSRLTFSKYSVLVQPETEHWRSHVSISIFERAEMGPPPGPLALNLKQKQLSSFPLLPIPKRMLAWDKPKRKQASRTPNAAARFGCSVKH